MKAMSQDGGKSFQLYDLAKDISEQSDLAEEKPNKLKGIIKRHAEWESTLMPQQWGWNKSLGYKDPDFGEPQPYHTNKK